MKGYMQHWVYQKVIMLLGKPRKLIQLWCGTCVMVNIKVLQKKIQKQAEEGSQQNTALSDVN